METKKYKTLFLCTGNSARSIMGELFLRQPTIGQGKFETFSAGANPKGEIHPMTLRVMKDFFKIDASGSRSKSLEEFKDAHMDFVITVCNDARENCPVWPGQPIIAHWSLGDPAAFEGSEEQTFEVFKNVGLELKRRCELLANLPFDKLDRLRLEEATRAIG